MTEQEEAVAALVAVRQAHCDDSITSKLDRREIDDLAAAMVAFRAAALPPEGAPFTATVTMSDLQLPGRARGALRAAGIRTTHQLVEKLATEVGALRGVDTGTLHEIKEAMCRHGLRFGMKLPSAPITREWLAEIGFRWHQFDRQPTKQWLLWIGDAADSQGTFEDLGVEVTESVYEGEWHCWVRSDCAGRYSRFLHLRSIVTRDDLIFILEGIVGRGFDRADVYNGSWMEPGRVARLRETENRLDRRIMRERPWRSIELDDTRGRALPGHMQAHEDQRAERAQSTGAAAARPTHQEEAKGA